MTCPRCGRQLPPGIAGCVACRPKITPPSGPDRERCGLDERERRVSERVLTLALGDDWTWPQ